MCGCYCGGEWKVIRRDVLTTEEGTKVIIHFKCRLCGYTFQSDEMDDEKDYDDLRDAVHWEVD